jgi:septal ring factor EnvC (AmiA/AmiB activator)
LLDSSAAERPALVTSGMLDKCRAHDTKGTLMDTAHCSACRQAHSCITCQLAAGIEDLREKREQIMKQIQDEEMEKQRIQQELAALTQRLSRVNESLARKVSAASMLPTQMT